MMSAASGIANAESHYRYIISWDYWDGMDERDNHVLYLNGKSIGPPRTALDTLNNLAVEKGEHLRIDWPDAPAGQSLAFPLFG